MKPYYIILPFFMLAAATSCFGQSDSTGYSSSKNISFAGGVTLQRQLMGEIGINYGRLSSEASCGPGGFVGLKLTSEFTNYHNALLVGPKIGFEANGSVIALKLSVVNYTDFNSNDVRLLPEIGFGTGFVNFFYGRNISLSASKFDVISKNRFSITVNFGKHD